MGLRSHSSCVSSAVTNPNRAKGKSRSEICRSVRMAPKGILFLCSLFVLGDNFVASSPLYPPGPGSLAYSWDADEDYGLINFEALLESIRNSKLDFCLTFIKTELNESVSAFLQHLKTRIFEVFINSIKTT